MQRDDVLVSTEWLADHLSDPTIRIVDARFALPGVSGGPDGRQAYLNGHIPGAVHLDWLKDLSDPNDPVEGQIAPPDAFQDAMERNGIGDDTLVIAYDDNQVTMAARVWWSLRYYGHDRVRLLDGGIGRWVAEGRPLEQSNPRVARGTFTPRVRPEMRTTKAEVMRDLATLNGRLFDCRMDATYFGTGQHIPGAKRLPGPGLLDATGQWRQTEEIARIASDADADPRSERIVLYCGGGVSASATFLGLTLAGYRNLTLYDGSWSEWGADPETPKEPHATS
jgi:thiosulfate/3-mercaptopyruvate sulfurtransferase